jgi:CPA2 family monovalent cation:H+ antiporter-2
MEIGHALSQAVVVLGAAVAVVFVFAKLRLPSIVGLILTGLLIGPSGLRLIADVAQVEVFAEIGVVLLLFTIGLELSIGELKGLGRVFALGGASQALLTGAAAYGLATLGGVGWRTALFAGFVVALSSTAVVLKLYDQRRETQTPQGRVVLGILLFQDLLIVPLIVLTPVVAGTTTASPAELALRFAGALVAVTVVAGAARFLMPRLLHQLVLVRVREIFVLAALFVCLAMAWFTHTLGFSLALGAFLAGLLVSETEYSHQVVADIVPFRDVFASLFFVSIGMLVDLGFAIERLPMLVGLAALLVTVKALVAGTAVMLTGFPVRIAVVAGLGLAQIGEFSFVLMEVGRTHGLLGGVGYQTLLMAAVLTLLVTPLLIRWAPALGERAAGLLGRPAGEGAEPVAGGLTGHVIVVGYGMNGSLLCRVLGEARIPYMVLELNAVTVRAARREGVPIVFGDASRREILEHAGIERAQAIVWAISDLPAVRRSLRLAKGLNPHVETIVRTRMVREIDELRADGADDIVAEEFEAAIEIFTRVLERFHVPRNVIRAQTRVLRGESYRMLRVANPSARASEAVLEALQQGTTELYQVGAQSLAAGRTLADLHLRRRTGASVIAVVRGERSYPNPSPEIDLETGDVLVLVGNHQQIDRAFAFLDREEGVDADAEAGAATGGEPATPPPPAD